MLKGATTALKEALKRLLEGGGETSRLLSQNGMKQLKQGRLCKKLRKQDGD